jgi:hypothetical protein
MPPAREAAHRGILHHDRVVDANQSWFLEQVLRDFEPTVNFSLLMLKTPIHGHRRMIGEGEYAHRRVYRRADWGQSVPWCGAGIRPMPLNTNFCRRLPSQVSVV